MSKIAWIKIVSVCFTISLIVGVIGGALTNEYLIGFIFSSFVESPDENAPIIKRVIEERTFVEDSLIVESIEKVEPSLVTIYSQKDVALQAQEKTLDSNNTFLSSTSDSFYLDSFANNQGTIIGGSGFFLTSDGLIMTCNSLVNTQSEWFLLTDDNKVLTAQVVYLDPLDDVALLKLQDNNEAEFFKTLPIGVSELPLGQRVLSVGKTPLGTTKLKSALVSSLGENTATRDHLRFFPGEFIELDAEIDAALQCGPLVNLGGELMGMTVDFDTIETGTAYAIPVDSLNLIFEEYTAE